MEKSFVIGPIRDEECLKLLFKYIPRHLESEEIVTLLNPKNYLYLKVSRPEELSSDSPDSITEEIISSRIRHTVREYLDRRDSPTLAEIRHRRDSNPTDDENMFDKFRENLSKHIKANSSDSSLHNGPSHTAPGSREESDSSEYDKENLSVDLKSSDGKGKQKCKFLSIGQARTHKQSTTSGYFTKTGSPIAGPSKDPEHCPHTDCQSGSSDDCEISSDENWKKKNSSASDTNDGMLPTPIKSFTPSEGDQENTAGVRPSIYPLLGDVSTNEPLRRPIPIHHGAFFYYVSNGNSSTTTNRHPGTNRQYFADLHITKNCENGVRLFIRRRRPTPILRKCRYEYRDGVINSRSYIRATRYFQYHPYQLPPSTCCGRNSPPIILGIYRSPIKVLKKKQVYDIETLKLLRPKGNTQQPATLPNREINKSPEEVIQIKKFIIPATESDSSEINTCRSSSVSNSPLQLDNDVISEIDDESNKQNSVEQKDDETNIKSHKEGKSKKKSSKKGKPRRRKSKQDDYREKKIEENVPTKESDKSKVNKLEQEIENVPMENEKSKPKEDEFEDNNPCIKKLKNTSEIEKAREEHDQDEVKVEQLTKVEIKDEIEKSELKYVELTEEIVEDKTKKGFENEVADNHKKYDIQESDLKENDFQEKQHTKNVDAKEDYESIINESEQEPPDELRKNEHDKNKDEYLENQLAKDEFEDKTLNNDDIKEKELEITASEYAKKVQQLQSMQESVGEPVKETARSEEICEVENIDCDGSDSEERSKLKDQLIKDESAKNKAKDNKFNSDDKLDKEESKHLEGEVNDVDYAEALKGYESFKDDFESNEPKINLPKKSEYEKHLEDKYTMGESSKLDQGKHQSHGSIKNEFENETQKKHFEENVENVDQLKNDKTEKDLEVNCKPDKYQLDELKNYDSGEDKPKKNQNLEFPKNKKDNEHKKYETNEQKTKRNISQNSESEDAEYSEENLTKK